MVSKNLQSTTQHKKQDFKQIYKRDSDLIYDNNVSPFSNNLLETLTFWQKIQIIICSVTIAPIRLVMVMIVLALLWPTGIILTYKLDGTFKKPITGLRKKLIPIASFLGRSLFFAAGLQRIKIVGEPDKNVKIMVTAPHTSFYDTVLFALLNFCSGIGRAGSDKILLFGNLVKLTQPIIVDREQRSSRSDSVKKLVERINSNDAWPPILIFAEGTCTNHKALLRFKQGAFIHGVPVQPVAIKLPKTLNYDSISWAWDGPSPYTLGWLSLCQINLPIEYHFMPVYNPSEEEKADPELYAENVRKEIARRLQLPLTDYSFEDVYILSRVSEYNWPYHVGLIKVQVLLKRFNIKLEDIYKLIPIYSKIADSHSGVCYLENFASRLHLERAELIDKLFNMFDRNHEGMFSLEQFVETYFEHFSQTLNIDAAFKYKQQIFESFGRFGTNESDYSREEFQNELNSIYGLRFISFDQFALKNKERVSKSDLDLFLATHPIHMLLFLLKLTKG